jgi:hypothetical protein
MRRRPLGCIPEPAPAQAGDRDGAGLVIDKIHRRFPWLELIWADGGYNGWQVEAADCRAAGSLQTEGQDRSLRDRG